MSDKKPSAGFDPDLIRELAGILRESGLSEIEIEQGGLRLKLAATLTQGVTHVTVPMSAPTPMAALPAPSSSGPAAAPAGAVLSPMVGTAFLSPEPGAAVFVKIGDQVAEGQTLLIVEAMKTFNPIPAPRAGKLVQLLVTDGQPVEYGQALAVLE